MPIRTLRFNYFICAVILLVLFSGCKKKSERLPLLVTLRVSEISGNFAHCGATVYFEGDAPITAKGICWSTSPAPTTANFSTNEGEGTSSFSSTMNNLATGTSYFVRAYATNQFGTYYAEEKSFKTNQGLGLITYKGTYVSSTTAASGGSFVVTPTQPQITEAGICWSTNQNPTIDNGKLVCPVVAGRFSGFISGLTPNTIYYLRSYVRNSTFIEYGNEIQFRTNYGTLTDIDGNVYQTVQIGTQVWMAQNLKVTTYRDGMPIPLATNNSIWVGGSFDGAYCYYANSTGNMQIYGAIYSWNTIVNSHNIAPNGWHVPSHAEWSTLVNYLGGGTIAGTALKTYEGFYWSGETASSAQNTSGFSALPGGLRNVSGSYYNLGSFTGFWSSSRTTGLAPFVLSLQSGSSSVLLNTNYPVESGFSIRLIKD